MAEYIFHSGGPNNTNPDSDLGGPPSDFPIANKTLNNLFDDISPEERSSGFIDYRCFYFINKNPNAFILEPIISLSQDALGSQIEYGFNVQDEVQRLTFSGIPDDVGYIVLATEFGPPFKADYEGSFGVFAANIQAALNLLPYCETCTATYNAVNPPNIEILFNGRAGRRKTRLIQLIANRLQSTAGGHFRAETWSGSSLFNHTGTSIIRVVYTNPTLPDQTYPVPGVIYAFDVTTGLYVEYTYTSINLATKEFNLSTPLTFDIVPYDEIYVPPIDDKDYLVKITKTVEGSPINTIADFVESKTTAPDVTFGTTPINLGTIFAFEGFPVWIQRTTPANIPTVANDSFDVDLVGDLYIL